MSTPPHLQRTCLGLGPAPGTMPPYQALSYPGGHTGINHQYWPGGLGNIPTYSQPYGAAPQPWGYGHYPGGYLLPGGYPLLGGFLPAGGYLPPAGGYQNTVPHMAVNKPKNMEADARAEEGGKGKAKQAEGVWKRTIQMLKSAKEISKNVWWRDLTCLVNCSWAIESAPSHTAGWHSPARLTGRQPLFSWQRELKWHRHKWLRWRLKIWWTTKHLPSNVKQLDHQPIKKPKGPTPPEVHIAVNFAPTLGGALPGSYVVLQGQQALPTTAPGSLCPKEVRTLDGDAKTYEIPPPSACKILVWKATDALFAALAKCTETGILLNTKEVLTLLNADDPQPDGDYRDSHHELVEFGIHNVLDIYRMDECFLATLGKLGRGGAQHLCQFTHDKILIPLQLVSEVVKAKPTIKYVKPSLDVARIQEWIAGVEWATAEVKEESLDGIEEVEFESFEDDIKEIVTDGSNTIVGEVVERGGAFVL
ncbi:hypothetical protein EI94DRAFT_1696518 [Lactarius quietus]|nr:hypothetical protein EI94DRAFT_1696518 [Lactarius quietus]